MGMLTDPYGLMLGGRAARFSLSAPVGNQPPIAVADSATVQRADGVVVLDVMANDVDLEGGALTLISAVATVGVAVAEANGTISYTPPLGTEVQDTITYVVADPEGLEATTTVTITIEDPLVSITLDTGNFIVATAQDGLVDITVTAPALFAGTYQANLADLSTGPAVVVAPFITGTLAEGEVLTAQALWIYDYDNAAPVISYQWLRGGADIPGAVAQTYSAGPADAGATLTVAVSATDATGTRTATSVGATIPGAIDPSPLYLASGGDTDTGAITTVDPAFGVGTVLHQPETSRRPAAADGLIAFDGTDLLQPVAEGYSAFNAKTLLPDGASGAEAGEGFTITGLARLTNGTWAAGNAGLPTPVSGSVQAGSVVILAADFSTILANYPVSDYDSSAVSAVQGVAQDGNGHLWYVAKQLAKLICVDPADGTEINQISLAYTPNGLAWDSIAGELIIHDQDAGVLRWTDPDTAAQSRTRAVPGDADQLHFDAGYMTQGAVWFTAGTSGNPGQVQFMDVATGLYEAHEESFAGTSAIEGLFYDRAVQKLYVADDAYFHNGTANGNAVYTYDLAPPLEQQFSLFFSGRVPSGGDTDCILAYGRDATTVAVTGLYRPSGGNSLRVILKRGGVSGPVNFTAADLSVDADYWIDVDLAANLATLFINGIEAEALPISASYPTWLAAGDGGITVGGCLQLSGNTPQRTTTMEIRAAGITFTSGQRPVIEALYT